MKMSEARKSNVAFLNDVAKNLAYGGTFDEMDVSRLREVADTIEGLIYLASPSKSKKPSLGSTPIAPRRSE